MSVLWIQKNDARFHQEKRLLWLSKMAAPIVSVLLTDSVIHTVYNVQVCASLTFFRNLMWFEINVLAYIYENDFV